MTRDLSHLSPRTAQVALLDTTSRIEYITSKRWVTYPRGEAILERMEDILRHPKTTRMPGMLLVGRSNNGKSALLEQFERMHPAQDHPEAAAIFAPVIRIDAPPSPSESSVYDLIMEAVASMPRPHYSVSEKRNHILGLLPKMGVKMLIVDEINSILSGSLPKQREFLNSLKFLSNMLKISIVAAGTQEALQAVRTDEQIYNRLKAEPLVVWKYDMDFRQLLADLETLLPLRQPSGLSGSALAKMIHARIDGTIGDTSEFLNAAAKWAVKNGKELIDIDALEKCGHRSSAAMQQELRQI